MCVSFSGYVKFLLILVFLITTGCSGTSKNFFDDKPPSSSEFDNSYVIHPHHAFGEQKYTAPSKYDDTVWGRLLSLYSLPEIENERIDREVNWYLRHPDYIARIQQRAEPYLHLILDEIEAKKLPGELALLPVVESAFLPDAYSRSDASGLWQFIPTTGNLFGLQQNTWYDGRRDVYASTKAATTFLKQLGESFDGDWHLALASYNFGKGNIRKAIEKNENLKLETDYWSLDLPKETADYVPRLLAIARIFANAEKYNINLQDIPNKPYCELVDVKSQLDLNKAAELANTPLDEFLKLNPGYNLSSTAPNGPHHLLIPVAKAQSFKENLAQLPDEERVDQQRYHAETTAKLRHDEIRAASNQHKVKAEETPVTFADKKNTTAQTIRKANHLASNANHSGMLLKMPALEKSTGTTPSTTKATKNKPEATQIYIVKNGDTLWNIAERFSVNDKDIVDWNKINTKKTLVLGQKLTIKTANHPAVATFSASRSISYTVKQGDSLAQISRKFKVSIADLRKWNSSTLSDSLTPGKKLKVVLNT